MKVYTVDKWALAWITDPEDFESPGKYIMGREPENNDIFDFDTYDKAEKYVENFIEEFENLYNEPDWSYPERQHPDL